MSAKGPTLHVLPDSARVEQALLLAARETGFVDASAFVTFAQLVEQCEGARTLGRRPCTPLVARAVVSGLARSRESGPFGEFALEPAFARGALELFFELKAGRCGPARFASAVESFPEPRRARGRYLAELYDRYETKMAKLALADREDLLVGAVQAMSAAGAWGRVFGRYQGLLVSHLHDFTPLRLDLMLMLAARCQEAGVPFQLELPGSGNPEVDGPVDAVHRAFEARWAELEVEVVKALPPAEESPLGNLGARLFRREPGAGPPSAALRAFSAPGPREECREVASRARDLVDQGVPPEDIAIAFRDLSSEAELLVEALASYGLPARSRLGVPLPGTAVGRLALKLPLLIEERYPGPRVARWLESRYAPSLGQVSTPARWLQLASVRNDALGARDGQGAYALRLGALADRLARAERNDLARQVGDTLAAARRLLKIGAGLPEVAPASQMLSAWWGCLEAVGLPRAVRQPEAPAQGTLLEQEVLRALARDQAAIEALRTLAADLAEALAVSGAAKQPLTRRAFHRWLSDAARDYNLTPCGPRTGAVRVLDVRELSGSGCSHLFVGGLVEGRFPARPAPSPLFPDDDRARVNAFLKTGVFRLAVADLPGKLPWRLSEDRLLLHLVLSASAGTTTLSYARRGNDGHEQPASPFLEELQRAIQLEVEALGLSPVRRLSEARSEQELRERAALEAFGRRELRASAPDPAGASVVELICEEPWYLSAGQLARIEEERLRFFSNPDLPPGPYTGRIDAEDLRSALAAAFAFDAHRPLSASALAKFGNCGFQGYLGWALRLNDPEEPGEEIDSRGRGTFWHLFLEELFPRLKDAKLLGRPGHEVPDALLDQALQRAASTAALRSHVGHPALWRLGQQRARAMARRVLNAEARGLPFQGLEPEAAEVSFGKRTSAGPWQQVVLPPGGPEETPIAFAGTIDRLDASASATGLIDYKSGRVKPIPKLAQALLTTEFQLPLYLYAARAAGHRGPLQAAWLQLKNGQAVPFDAVLAHDGLSLDELLATSPEVRRKLKEDGRKNLANAVHALVGRLRAGQFPARPEDCEHCAFRSVCRVSERRLEEVVDA